MILIGPEPVWVLEDDPADQMVVEAVLRRTRFDNEVELFSTREALLEALRTRAERPALLLLDVNLGGCCGLDVLAEVRAQPTFASLPIIAMLTSSDAERDRVSAEALGADAFLAKPSGVRDFVQVVERTFGSRPARSSEAPARPMG